MRFVFTLILLLSFSTFQLWGQSRFEPFQFNNAGELRSLYHQNININEKYSTSFDGGSYLGIGTNVWTRWGFRGSIKRNINYRLAVDFGFMYNHITYESKVSQEYRPHQSFFFNYPTLEYSTIQHRIRLEERIFNDNIRNEHTIRSRIRYRISNQGTLKKKPVSPKAFYYRLSAEWNFNIYNEIEGKFLLRGRYGIGYGYQFNSKFSADANYFMQHDAQQNSNGHSILHIFQFSFRQTIRL